MIESDKQRNIKTLKAASWYTVCNFITKCMHYLFTPIYTRVLTDVQYGAWSNYSAWRTLLYALLSLDLAATVGIAFIDYKDPKKFNRYISTIAFLSFVVPAAFGVIMMIFNREFAALFGMEPIYVFLMVISISTSSALGIFQAEQRAKIAYKLSCALSLGVSFGSMIVTLFAVWLSPDKQMGVVLGGICLTATVNIAVGIYLFSRGFQVLREDVAYALRFVLPLIPHVVSNNLLSSANKIMINKFCGNAETALFSVVNTCSLIVGMFVTSVNSAWGPWFYNRMAAKDYASIRKVVKVTVPLMALIALALCLVGPEVVLIVGGRNYAQAIYLMPPLIIGCLVRYIYTLYVNIEFYNKKTGGISVGTIITALIHIALNFILLPIFGYRAAAYTTLIADLVLLVIHMVIVKRQGFLDVFNNRYNIGVLLAGGAVCMSVMLLYSSTILRYAVIAVILIVMIVLAVKNKDMILSLLKRKKG